MLPDAGEEGGAPALAAALLYLERGWAVVPVEPRGKRPFNPDEPSGRKWQELRGDADDLNRWFGPERRNVGVILGAPSGGLTDIDLDSTEALTLAPRLLPKTEAVFGRESKARSHWLYVAQVARSRQFKDPEGGAVLLELRSDGMQTVFPPSIHPSGETIDWSIHGEPLATTAAKLERIAGKLAAAALLARSWPGQGGRHDAALTLTAFLKRAGWPDEQIAHFVACVSAAAGGEADLPKRLAAARDAAARLDTDRPVRGLPAFVDLVGAKRAQKIAEWLGVTKKLEQDAGAPALPHGSHVAQANAALDQLRREKGDLVHCEGAFWAYAGACWRVLPADVVRRSVYALDAAVVPGRRRPLSLTNSSINGVISEMAVLAAAEGHFDDAPQGFNCENGLIVIGPDGVPDLVAHDPTHRRRFVASGAWTLGTPSTPPGSSLFAHFLRGSFGDDESGREIVDLLAEVAGIAALGAATRLKEPVAVILFGPTAANGKSQLLELLRGLVSPDAVVALSPDLFDDQKHLVMLAGRMLNACDELGGTAIFSEAFKAIISGEPIAARDVYKSAFSFRPRAQHVLATNQLPAFRRGLDRGVQRRVLIVPMMRSIPPAEQVPEIARKILKQESHLVLAWAVAGACRAIARGDLARPRTCIEAQREWIEQTDVVLSWLFDEEEVAIVEGAWVTSNAAYAAFKSWAGRGGFSDIPNIKSFSTRVCSAGIKGVARHRKSHATGIDGLKLKRSGGSDDAGVHRR